MTVDIRGRIKLYKYQRKGDSMNTKRKVTAFLLSLMAVTAYSCGAKADESQGVSATAETTTTIQIETTTEAETTLEVETTTEAETTEPPAPVESKYKTYIGSCTTADYSFQIPKSWIYNASYWYFETYCINYSNGETSLLIQTYNADSELSDEENLNKRIDDFWKEPTCTNVDIFQLDDIKYARSSYSSADFYIYAFCHNGTTYQLNVTDLGYIPNGESIIQDIISSFRFSFDNYDYSFSRNFDSLSTDEKMLANYTFTFMDWGFENRDTVIINQCGITKVNDKDAVVYDISYLSKDNVNKTDVFIYYPDENTVVISDQSFNELITAESEFNVDAINQVLNDYIKQL